ncbi:MAG TPA: DSD1 family PLP-dependent enzyme [Methylobacterium sp.]|nr:DSD1 family PLP-dependent enzyme [Methylobacterium sp.]
MDPDPGAGDAGPNARLLGSPGGRGRLDTPALLVDGPALARNIARMAALTAARDVALRPHVKTHKSVAIARMQVEAGAIGVSCATLGEAEAMVAGAIPGVLITSPIVPEGKVARLIALARRAGPDGVMVVVDHPRNVRDLGAAAGGLGFPLGVLIDDAAGYHRTGVAGEAEALALARAVAAEPALRLEGLQAYAGNLQHIPDRRARASRASALRHALAGRIEALRRAGVRLGIVTGVGTGTHDLDSTERVFTEIQPGSYVFLDAEYGPILADGPDGSPFETALFVQATVVSTNAPDWVTTDAGAKSLSIDHAARIAHGCDPASTYAVFGDEHGRLVTAGARPDLGARIELVTPHCDPTVNLYDRLHVVAGETLVAIWPIEARGR